MGNVEDMSKLASNVDIIICVVGTAPQQPKEKCIMLKTAEALLAATDARHKIFFCSSLGMNGSSSIIYGLLAMIAGKPNVQDCDAADKLLMNSIGLKGGPSVTVMRPAALGDGDTGKYLALPTGSAAVGVLGRADLSQFMLDNLEGNKWENKAVHLYAVSGFSCYYDYGYGSSVVAKPQREPKGNPLDMYGLLSKFREAHSFWS